MNIVVHFVLFVGFACVLSAKVDSDILKNYSEFFNFGSKKTVLKIERDKYENTIIKSKVDILGSVFKTNVDALKAYGILDLIFLIDASSSVGEHNFKSELKFVKKLLSDVTVDINHTRVAVVTFSSQNTIITNIDEISKPKEENNKCRLLNNEINEIEYTGGGTYTLGAFNVAKTIFEKSRKEARKVLFLITDGFSNGGDPVPIATELKDSQVTIFTIGILNGNYKELYELSTTPGEMYSYLLDSFEEFESLARRALHVDLQSGDYIPLGISTPCDRLCNGTDCCDRYAVCTCGTATGHYSCLCKPGFYGSGLKNSCSPCPSGSYSGGPNLCLPCPDIHHYTRPPATDISSCTCKHGYQSTAENGCEVIKCPKLEPPENGYFVRRRECSNVLNSACGARCNVGYTLAGSSIRLCQLNATWSGLAPSCQVKTCKKMHAPTHGTMSCKHYDLDADFTNEPFSPVDTVCSFGCERGRTLIGSSQRTCLPLAQWDGLRTSCKQIKCNKLSKVNFGAIEPKSCTVGKQPFGKKCNVTCDEGYSIIGPTQKVCNENHGNWDSQEEMICKDITKPIIHCPDNIKSEAVKGKAYGTVSWRKPNATDNAGGNVTIWTKPAIKNISNFKFKIGNTTVTYFAQDASNNKAKCSFVVQITDMEPPVIEECIDPPPFLMANSRAANISWDEPNIFDNSQNVQIMKSHEFGLFDLGTTAVTYNAIDASNNTNTCILNITVQESKCELLPDPIYGHSKCVPFSDSVQCVVTCEEGYALPMASPIGTIDVHDNTTNFICEHNEPIWYNKDGGGFPECTVTELPVEVNQTGTIQTEDESTETCLNQTSVNMFENDIKTALEKSCEGLDCHLKTEANCSELETEIEEEQSNVIKRQTRDAPSAMGVGRRRKKKKGRRIKVRFQMQAKSKVNGKTKNIERLGKVLGNMTGLLGRNVTVHLERPKVMCPAGSFNRKYRCVRCPEGTFHNSTVSMCQSCQIGSYNNKIGQTVCIACPKFYSTRKLHAKSSQDCYEQCPPGTFARKKQIKHPKNHPNSVIERVTLKPYCSSCPIAYYQPNYGQLGCIACPDGFTTLSRGSLSQLDCVSIKLCNETGICHNGQCVVEIEFYYSCICGEYYIGAHCEVKVDPCASSPCQNEGICKYSPTGYTCECVDGFTGVNCAHIEEKCELDCKNNATCATTEEDDKICICHKGFTGALCETQLSFCSENICENGGVCMETTDAFVCKCKGGYIGHRCTLLPCDFQPCPITTLCVNMNNDDANRNSYRCDCLAGYEGTNCTKKINYCNSNPCSNGGSCESNDAGFKCVCRKGFDGENCGVKLRSDFVLNFPRSGVTDYISLDGFEQNLTEVTACLWLQTRDSFNYGTILSYATKVYDNAFTITDYTGLVFYINNKYIVTDVLLNDGYWHHFCAVWKSFEGQYQIYMDGKILQTGQNLSSGANIGGGGKLVIGQEQDVLGGKFSQSESFLGSMAYIDIYSRALNSNEIKTVMNSCDDSYGDVYAWPEFAAAIKGDIKIQNSSFCQNCSYPEPPFNGYVNITDGKAFYGCNKGFNLDDNAYPSGRQCNKAAKWEGISKPFCKAVNCGHPGYIRNGYLMGKIHSYGEEVSYKCKQGFNMTGSPIRVCKDDGNWKPDAPKCIGVQCPKFIAPKHSTVIVMSDEDAEVALENYKGLFNVDTQVEITCADNAKLEGENIITCLEDGTWEYDEPMCKVEKVSLPCLLEHIPLAPDNGYMIQDTYDRISNGSGLTVEYTCRRGYILVGDNSSTCIIDGYWSELKMSCQAKVCGSPPKYTNMVLKLQEQPQGYQIGNMVAYECIQGYKTFGNAKLRCLMPGVWNRMQGKCIRISCGKPAVGKGSAILGGSYLYKDKVKLICQGEERVLQCGGTGKWEGDKSNC